MITISYDGPLIPKTLLDSLGLEPFREVIADVADSARNHWIALAEKDNSHLRFDYITGIQKTEFTKDAAIITLAGELPHLLEDGDTELDLRKTLLGPNVPIKTKATARNTRGKMVNAKGKFYRYIPFRHTTPGSKKAPRGRTVGKEIGAAYGASNAVEDAKKLGLAVYKKAKKLRATVGMPYGKTAWGGRLDDSKIRAGMKKGLSGVPLLKPHHKSSIYKGMMKMTKTYEAVEQSQYMTFRTISESVTEGWIRPPITARHYGANVDSFVRQILPRALDQFIKGII